MRSGMLDQLWTSIADAGRDLVRTRLYGRRRPPIRDLCRDLLSTKGRGLRRGARARAGRGLPGHGRGGPAGLLQHAGRGLRCRPGADPGRRRGLPRPADPVRGPCAAARLRGAAPRAVPADEHRPRRDASDRRPAHAAARPAAGPSRAGAGRRRPARPARRLVQSGLPDLHPRSTGTARPRCWRSSCATRRSTGCARWRT